jgi:hypothetical protein
MNICISYIACTQLYLSNFSGVYIKEPRRPGFDPGSGQVGFVVDKVALGQVFSEYLGCPCQSSFHQLLHNHPHLSSGAGTIGQKWPQYKGLSPTPLNNIYIYIYIHTHTHTKEGEHALLTQYVYFVLPSEVYLSLYRYRSRSDSLNTPAPLGVYR